ncbi:MAG: cytochrome c oxidase subunit II [Gammaproteobacteria bacterium]
MRKWTLASGVATTAGLAMAPGAWAMDLNMPRGVTPISHQVFALHMFAFWMMVGIAVVVFGALTWSIVFHRRARGHEAAQFHENTKLEVVWSIAPFLILVALAIPGTIVLVHEQNYHHAQLRIRVTGYQWLWKYEYLSPSAKPLYGFYSRIALASEKRMTLDSKLSPWSDKNYLEDVDHPLVVPTHEKILLLITSGDVIHSWWVPDLGGKQDAIPGFVTQMWINVEKPGTYRGVCNQVCGAGHAYMPIVVVAKPKREFEQWLQAHELGGKAASAKTVAHTPALVAEGTK